MVLFAAGVFALDHLLGDYPFNRRGHPVFYDHLAYYSAGRLVREGRAGELYDLASLHQYQTGLFPGREIALEAFRNPPFVAQLVGFTTARLPFAASGWAWQLVGIAAYLGGLRLLHPRPPLFAVATVPAVLCVSYGQVSLLAAGVLAVVGRLVIDRRPFAAGLVAGLLWAKPPLLLGLVVWGLLDLRRLWPAAVGCVLTGAALTAGSYALHPEAWAGFAATLWDNANYSDFDWWKAPGPRPFWRLLIGEGRPATALWLLTVALGLWGFVRVWRANRGDGPVLFAAALLLTLWATPHAMIYEWAVIAVPWVLLDRHAPGGWRWPFVIAWLALAGGTEVGMWQAKLWGEPIVMLSAPMLGWAGWRAVRRLTSGPGERGA